MVQHPPEAQEQGKGFTGYLTVPAVHTKHFLDTPLTEERNCVCVCPRLIIAAMWSIVVKYLPI